MYRDDGGLIVWTSGNPPATARVVVVGSGLFPVEHRQTFAHPVPGFNRLFIFLAGSAEVAVGRTVHRIVPGGLWLLPAHLSFRVTYAAGSRFHFFHARWLDALGGDRLTGPAPVRHPLDAVAGELLARHGVEGDGDPAHWHPLLLATLARFLPESHAGGGRADRHRELIEYVQREPAHGLTIAALARRVRLSPAALSKRFRRDTGIALKRWLVETVIERARDLLAGSDRPVQDIAADLGYPDPFYFQRAFKRLAGITPSAFRRAARDTAGGA